MLTISRTARDGRITIRHHLGLLALAFGLLAACGSLDLPTVLQPSSPYDDYRRSLAQADLDSTVMGAAWVDAGESALVDPPDLELPFAEAVRFGPSEPAAVAYRMTLERGTLLTVDVELPGPAMTDPPTPRWFIDLFVVVAEGPPRRVAQADAARLALRFEAATAGAYILRVQPELLVGGALTVRAVREATVGFPVSGHRLRDVGSRFGDPRPGGRRHEGVDIFAPRGTPVVAAVDGVVSRVGTNRLGGNVVWMRGGGRTFYYAHLDQHSVSTGARVRTGEELGQVGNTGNARTTPPHLHFGIYQGPAVDPLPYLRSDPPPAAVTADLDPLGGWSRVRGARANVRRGPSTQTPVLTQLDGGTALVLRAAQRDWYRANLPDGRVGYLFGTLAEPADRPLRELALDTRRNLSSSVATTSRALAALPAGARVDVLATFGERTLVRTDDGLTGWI